MKRHKVPVIIIIVAMFFITILELFALKLGHNGTILSLVIGALAGLAGWTLPQLKT